MKDNATVLLNETIERELDNLYSLESGGEEHARLVEAITKLYKLRIEENKNEADLIEKQKEEQLKRELMNEQVKDRWIRVAVEAGEIVAPLIFYGVWMARGFKFEETGTYCSQTFRNLFSRFKPTRK